MDIKLLEKCFVNDNETSQRIVDLCRNIFYHEPSIDVFTLTQKVDDDHYNLVIDILNSTRDKEELRKLNVVLRTYFVEYT